MLRRIPFTNKLLSLEHTDDSIYIGDSRGHIYKMVYPFTSPTKVFNVSSPISSLVWHKDKLFYANWDGEVGFTDFKGSKSVFIVRDIVKCMTIFKDHIFVSIDYNIFVLDTNLNIKGKLEPPHKVLSFYTTEDKCVIGMSVPFVAEIIQNSTGFELVNFRSSKHDTAVLSIYEDFTGSSDGKVLSDDKVIYSSSGWINSIFSKDLFSSGKSVIKKSQNEYKEIYAHEYKEIHQNEYKEIYAHEDDVMKVISIKDKVVSISLDYTVCVWEEEKITDEELLEIEELNRMC